MTVQKDHIRDGLSTSQGNLESPFLQEELFGGEKETEWETRLSALEAENPYQKAFEQGLTSLNEPKEEKEEFVIEEELPSLHPCHFSKTCQLKLQKTHVAVVGAGFAGLMAARQLSQCGIKVTVFEARSQVGGRVRSNSTWSNDRITEEGAELIGSFHTYWLALAREYGLSMISRMDNNLYEREGLDVKLTLGKKLSMDEIKKLDEAMETRVLRPIARLASQIQNPSQPWTEPWLGKYDKMSVADVLAKKPVAKDAYGIDRSELLWKYIEFKLVNDEVAPLDEMNFLGLLCKVKAGQGVRFRSDSNDPKQPLSEERLMRYWNELEIFRCADGCQALANVMVDEIKRYGATLRLKTAVTSIELSKQRLKIGSRNVVNEDKGKLADRQNPLLNCDYVIFAIPPSVWDGVTIKADGAIVHFARIGMDPAVKFFSDMKKRFWIREKAAPSGGSLKIGQVWEGTDNQTRIPGSKQGIVLSVFAGPIITIPLAPGGTAQRAPNEGEFEEGLKELYPGYLSNRNKKLFRNWPEVPFIMTGYASPRKGQIFGIGKMLSNQKLSRPLEGWLFFAGEHTQMDFFGYMEGALRSGERAARDLILQLCDIQTSIASGAPTRAKKASEYETESSLLDRDLFAARAEYELEPRAPPPVMESSFVDTLEEDRNKFGEYTLEEEAALNNLEGEEVLEPEEVWEELGEEHLTSQTDQEEDESLDYENAPLSESKVEFESPGDLEESYNHVHGYELDQAQTSLIEPEELEEEFFEEEWAETEDFTLDEAEAYNEGEGADLKDSLEGEVYNEDEIQYLEGETEEERAITRMKFEFQTKNRIWRNDGKAAPTLLERKYGPNDFLVEDKGVRLESETRGILEFETEWFTAWNKLEEAIKKAVKMTDAMNKAGPSKFEKTRKEFPFNIGHLRKGSAREMRQGFWDKRKGMEGTKEKILGAKEELEVEILDPNWEAGIQSSESFLLDYYESFLKQHEWQFFRDGAINHTKAILDAVNTDKVPATELVKLRSFLQIIVNYIMRGQGGKESKNAGAFSDVKGLPAKQAFTLMSRTNFASIYRWLLTEKEKKLFQKIVKTDAILKEMGLDRESPVFIKGYGTERHEPGPTVYKWLSGIPKGVDLLSTLSGKGLSAAMGRYSVETRKGKKDRWHVKFETRNTTMGAVRIKARDWVKYASKLFDLASNRELDSLKLVYKQGITDENKLTNFVFYAHHPEMGGRKIRSDALAQKWLQTRDDLVRPFLLSAQPELETFEAFDDAEFEDEEFQDEFENGAETSYGYTNYELAGEEEHPFYEMENDEDLTEIEANSTETEEEELENEFLREDDYSPSYIENNEDMQTYEGLEPLIQGEIGEIDQAIRTAKKQMQVHYNLQMKYAAGAGKTNNGTAARKEMAKYWEWSHERDFLERLKAVYESQTGVPLNYRSYPVTKVDPNTGKSGKDNPWRPSTKRQIFQQLEADGSFCLGASRAMAFRAIFGLDKPSNRAVLTDLKKKIEAARASGNTDAEARLIISRIVSHSHDPGSMKQFNHDLASRYGIKNTIVRAASRSEAFDALKKGAPIIADLEGGWHWVLVQKSPRGQLWANDPLLGSGIRKISSSELGSRFEIIIDAKTGEPITLNKAPEYQN